MKKVILYCIVGLLLGVGLSLYYDRNLNTFMGVFMRAADESDRWAAELRKESDAPCYVFTAGSQVRMGCVYPKVMYDEYGVRAINAAASAGYGLACNTTVALSYLRPGDYLFVETRDLEYTRNELLTSGGLKYCFQRLGIDMFSSPLINWNVEALTSIAMCEAGEISMYLVSRFLPSSDERLASSLPRIHESGWCEAKSKSSLKMRSFSGGLSNVKVSTAFREYLNVLKTECKARGVNLCSFMHAHYIDETAVPRQALVAMRLIEEGIPVLKEIGFGCETDPECFSDSINHLSRKGAIKYSRLYARSIVNNEYWTRKELEEILAKYGYAPDGTLFKS
ncbi:MAG: hypothetical protein IKV13_00265 [Akkermansia sp.]|nr:hypothetical protein [Akkermansia sp.]